MAEARLRFAKLAASTSAHDFAAAAATDGFRKPAECPPPSYLSGYTVIWTLAPNPSPIDVASVGIEQP